MSDSTGWLDLCCGTGRALIQAAGELRLAGLTERTQPLQPDQLHRPP
ncbi:hypothetical protein ACH4OY_30650 [Micromonospora rubida]|uniref:SAM-dependent methyltransferase n=1 Tax=Micromonospora rubida TaxID=2697657 RepID=A0ABW7STI0_9ACTN